MRRPLPLTVSGLTMTALTVSAAVVATAVLVTALTVALRGEPPQRRPGTRVTAAGLPAPVPCRGCRHPAPVTSWEWRLESVPTEPFLDVGMYDIDGFEATAATVERLHATRPGRIVVCYISAGTYEKWRPDAARFPSDVLGEPMDEWEGERWLDIRRYDGTLGAILRERMDMCRAKGFDAVEFDNVDGYDGDRTGFPLTAGDQLRFNAWLANEAHARGLSAGLKNDIRQLETLRPYFDWALNEECWAKRECTGEQTGGHGYDAWIAAGKPVFNVEYDLDPGSFCDRANAQNFNSLRKSHDLDATRTPCRGA
ncbi:MAG TPA: endo alpha-1,4 polygalactosaminidase [Spirillospora sp.]